MSTKPSLRGDRQCPHGHTARHKCPTCDREDDQKEIDRLSAENQRLREALETTRNQLRADVCEYDDIRAILDVIDSALEAKP